MRVSSGEERAQEKSVLYSNLIDTFVIALLIGVAVTTGSLTMIGEAVRASLMLSSGYFSLWLLLALHRGRLAGFEYGVGKIERCFWLVVGAAMLISALWVALVTVEAVFTVQQAPTPIDLTWAAVINAFNVLCNAVGWYAMYSASGDNESDVFKAQLRARFTMLVSSLTVQVTLTAAALAKDAPIALILDALGAAFVVGLMLHSSISMIAEALPDVLDAPAAAPLRKLIQGAITSVVPADEIVSIRTRRSGRVTFAEVAVAGLRFQSIDALREQTAAIRNALGHEGAAVELSVVVAPEGTSAAGGT